MRYVSIYTHPPHAASPSDEHIANMTKLIEEGHRDGWLVITEGVSFGQNGVRVHAERGKVSVTDGPFTEAKEVVGGYAILQVKSHEEALALARKFLAVTGEGTCEMYRLFDQTGTP
jgi:hypothetical protein